jgi:prepilin-type N-terminal cleavage/methylation domain-containing protein
VVKGFSLIELIVVVGLLAILMLAISSSILMSVISSNRIRTVTITKQAGNYALDQIQSMIRNAKDISICDPAIVSIVHSDGSSSVLSTQTNNGVNRIISNSDVFLTPANVSVSDFLFSCLPDQTPPASNLGNTDLIKISFSLKNTTVSRTSENPTLHFETSINLRNQ